MPETLTLEKPEVVEEATTHPIRLAFIGAAGSGKTTHAKLMQKKYKGDVLSFAAPLKKVCSLLFGDRMDEDPVFARKALQVIGTDAIRALDPETWIRLLLEKISDTRNCYVDDCRFPNEYYALKRLGFSVVRLDAEPETLMRRRPTLTKEQATHESEQHQLYFRSDVTVRSDPDIALLLLLRQTVEDEGTPTLPRTKLLMMVEDSEDDIRDTHERIVQRLHDLGALP